MSFSYYIPLNVFYDNYMKLLDPGTIILLSALLSLMMAAVFISISRGVSKVIDGVTSWALAYMSFSVGAALLLTHNRAPIFISIILSNSLLAFGVLLIYRGFRRFFGLTVPRKWPLASLAVYIAVMLFFTYVVPHYNARVIVCMLYFVVVFSIALRLVWRAKTMRKTPGIRLVAAAILGVILAAFVRGADTLVALGTVQRTGLFSAGSFLSYYLIANALSIVFLSVALVVLIHEKLREELHELAAHDPLTGVLTRRVVMGILDKMVAKLRRTGEPFGLMMFDLDYFKRVNDTYGHLAGDEVLAVLIRAIERSLRTEDYIGRYGGEEFMVVMGNLDMAGITAASERIRRIAEQTAIVYKDKTIRSTVSIGAAVITRRDTDTGDVPVAVVDAALYEAKHSGRNTTVIRQH